jgi:hypothetical protein
MYPSRYALARALGIRPSAVYAWPNGELPPLRVYQLRELAQNGTITEGRTLKGTPDGGHDS